MVWRELVHQEWSAVISVVTRFVIGVNVCRCLCNIVAIKLLFAYKLNRNSLRIGSDFMQGYVSDACALHGTKTRLGNKKMWLALTCDIWLCVVWEKVGRFSLKLLGDASDNSINNYSSNRNTVTVCSCVQAVSYWYWGSGYCISQRWTFEESEYWLCDKCPSPPPWGKAGG
jgi:hypothetical protein